MEYCQELDYPRLRGLGSGRQRARSAEAACARRLAFLPGHMRARKSLRRSGGLNYKLQGSKAARLVHDQLRLRTVRGPRSSRTIDGDDVSSCGCAGIDGDAAAARSATGQKKKEGSEQT